MKQFNVGILGSGAIGQLFCHQLVNLKPLLLGRTITPKSTTFIDANGNKLTRFINYQNIKTADLTHLDLLIVTVKAYQVSKALSPLLANLPIHCALLLMHNGMGSHIELAPQLDNRPLLLGTTSQGALRHDYWSVQHTGIGETHIGQFSGMPFPLWKQKLLLKSIPNCLWREDIITALWQKLAINAAINPLTAIYQCNNGQLIKNQFTDIIDKIIDELVEVAFADGVRLNKQSMLQKIFQVIKLTAQNFSSMHQDIAKNRQTEITAISGHIVNRAKTHNIKVPINQEMLAKVLNLSKAS